HAPRTSTVSDTPWGYPLHSTIGAMIDDKTATNGGSSDNPFGGLTIDLSGGFGGLVAEGPAPTSTRGSRGGGRPAPAVEGRQPRRRDEVQGPDHRLRPGRADRRDLRGAGQPRADR